MNNEEKISNEEKIINVINMLRPYINADGGDIEYLKYEDNIVYVKLRGACAGCAYRDDTINDFVLRTIQNEVPEVQDIINIPI